MLSKEQLDIEEYKLCEICNTRLKYCKEMCQHCYLYHRKLKLHLESPLIPCECGCGEVIHSIGKNGMSVNHAHHHTNKKGEDHNWWRGGITKTSRKYIKIYNPNHPNCDCHGYVSLHRLVMEQHIGRYLTKGEVVHHIDKNKQNNDISNLMLFPNDSEHLKYERTIDTSNRFCSNPECVDPSTTYYDKRTGKPNWFKYNNAWECGKCYAKRQYLKKKNKV
jgi:hypothetical protein